MGDLTFISQILPPLPGPRLEVDIGTLYYRPLHDTDLPSSSRTSIVKID